VGRKKIITPENVAEVIETVGPPFVTTKSIANELDVTPQAVRNNEEQLAKSGRLIHGKVGRSTVYWLPNRDKPPEAVTSTGEPPESDTDDSRGILDRLFADVPRLGSPKEVWFLAGLTALLGLTLGVGIGLLVAQPPVGVAAFSVSVVLAVALTVTLPVAVFETIRGTQRGAETA